MLRGAAGRWCAFVDTRGPEAHVACSRMEPRPRDVSSPIPRRRRRCRGTAPCPRADPRPARSARWCTGERHGTLSTVAADPAGYPFGSVVSFGLADDGDPLLFVSLMAEHAHNTLRDPGRASSSPSRCQRVLIPWRADASRCSDCSGRSTTSRARHRPRQLSRGEPSASYYIDFGDFTFLQLSVERVRYVGGYGRIVGSSDRLPNGDARPPGRRGRRDHRAHERRPRRCPGAVLPALRRARGHPVGHMSAVDRYGFDLVAVSDAHRTAVRLAFPDECTTGDQVRRAMVAMVAEARAASS